MPPASGGDGTVGAEAAGSDLHADWRHDADVTALSGPRKTALLSGRDEWHLEAIPEFRLPTIRMSDGTHGLRKVERSRLLRISGSAPATCFPTGSALGASWDRSLLHEVGVAIASEAIASGVDVVLGPGVNIKRSPLCGRNFEYFSEDPLLSGELAAAYICGVQSRGVGACLKHFAVNSQETYRMVVDAVVDDRTLREIYLPAFEIAVMTARPWSVMCSYNRLNGVYSSENVWLLTSVLRHEWGFDGLVVTDWGATDDRVAAVAAGTDLEMPGGHRSTMARSSTRFVLDASTAHVSTGRRRVWHSSSTGPRGGAMVHRRSMTSTRIMPLLDALRCRAWCCSRTTMQRCRIVRFSASR